VHEAYDWEPLYIKSFEKGNIFSLIERDRSFSFAQVSWHLFVAFAARDANERFFPWKKTNAMHEATQPTAGINIGMKKK